MEQRKCFCFDESLPHLRRYSTINSTDAKAPVILGSKNSFNTGRTWLSYVDEDDRWSPLEEKEADATNEGKRKIAKDQKLVKLQALPCHDYHSPRDVIVPNTNLFVEKSFKVDEKSERESVSWSGTKLAVIVSPKFEYSSGAITHVNERYQLRRFGDKEVKMKMTLAHTDVPAVSLQYLLGIIHPWLHSIKESERLSKYLADVDESEASMLSSLLRKLSQDLLKVPTPPLTVIPIYQRDPSKVLEKLLETLGEERLKQHHVPISAQSIGTAQETYSTMLAMTKSLIENGLQESAFEVENVGGVKIVSALQRVIDHAIIATNGFPLEELGAENSTMDGLTWIEKTTELLSKLPNNENAEKQDENVYLREVNGASLMLEIAESLESSEDVLLNKANLVKCDDTGSSSLDALDVLQSYKSLVAGRVISLECEPRPFSYRLVDGGPDQKQSHLPTKIAAAIEFRMEMNAHACIQRRAERDSVANEAERGNSILGRAATVGSSISNSTFKTSEDCLKKFEKDLEGRSIKPEEVTNMKKLASSLGEDFTAEMNMWYGAKELANRWNGFPCFGQNIFAKTPLSFYQLPLSHLLEADIQAYSKANKKEKNKEERFDWIRLNLEWYDNHGYISPSGYYEERRACNNPTCCGKRMLPLARPQSPKPSLFKFKHYEDSREVHNTLKEGGLNEKLDVLKLFPEIPVDEDG